MIHIGFTGTRHGMSLTQFRRLREGLITTRDHYTGGYTFHHGDCVGADTQACVLADMLGMTIHSHPPSNDSLRAFNRYDLIEEPIAYLRRNRAIVKSSILLIATPGQAWEAKGSGTWATVRYARKTGNQILIVWPDGSVKREVKSCS